jgi:hypothetical protein
VILSTREFLQFIDKFYDKHLDLISEDMDFIETAQEFARQIDEYDDRFDEEKNQLVGDIDRLERNVKHDMEVIGRLEKKLDKIVEICRK